MCIFCPTENNLETMTDTEAMGTLLVRGRPPKGILPKGPGVLGEKAVPGQG